MPVPKAEQSERTSVFVGLLETRVLGDTWRTTPAQQLSISGLEISKGTGCVACSSGVSCLHPAKELSTRCLGLTPV